MDPNKSHDKVFFRSFAAVMGALFAIFFACIAIARLITPAPAPDAAAATKLEARIRPMGQAITDSAALLKVSATKTGHAPMSADQVFGSVCSACHSAGLLGAPKAGDKGAWSARAGAAGGVNGLVTSAIKGKNSMPPRGGNPDLSDAELKATIELMMKKSGV